MASGATATGSLGLLHRVAVAAAALVAGLALFVTGFAVGSARGESGKDAARIQPLPDWFLPIWDAYDRNPAIGPGFDFASIYAPHRVNVTSTRR